MRWGTPTIRSSRAHVAGAAALALAVVGIVLAVSLFPNVRAAQQRSYFELKVDIDQQAPPDITFRFFLDSLWNGSNPALWAKTVVLLADIGPELSVDGDEGGTWSANQTDVPSDTWFNKTVVISEPTKEAIAANPSRTVFGSVNVTVTYTDDSGYRPRTIFRAVTFALNYQRPSQIGFAGAALAGLGGAGAVGLALYVRRRARLEELFLMHNSGTLIRHWTHADGPVNDGEAVSGMLIVLQEFVRDSFDDRQTSLQELRFGKQRVVLVGGQHTILAAVVRGRYLNDLPGRLQQAVWEFEGSSDDVLPIWDGNVDLSSRADLLATRFLRIRHHGMAS